jgi:hypothetical protein
MAAGARRRRALASAGLVWTSAALACVALASPVWAADQFTIDPTPDSFGAVVTDTAGNGYVAWEHAGTGGAADQPMFCKLAPSASHCAHPVSLSLPGAGAGDQSNALAPFPILGPGSTVWVVASRYVLDDTLIWTSSDGGATFGAPHEIPYIPSCPCSYSYAGLTGVDDSLPITLAYATYNRQRYLTASGQPSVYWLESSNNPGLGFSLDDTAEVSGGALGASTFTFSNPGGGGVGGSALGTTSVGEVVEAYWLDTTPPKLAYYAFYAHNPHPIAPQAGWTGPTVLGAGYMPRLADGAAGLFMLSSDSIEGAEQPAAIDLRSYDTTKHAFGAPARLAVTPSGVGSLFRGGGLGENYDTGELAAVWPTFSGADMMRLYLSTDGGKRFTPAQYVATVGDSYADFDNARVAIADDGTGFVTFQDARGLEVADLYALSRQFQTLHVHRAFVRVPATCPAPQQRCKVTVTLRRTHTGKIAHGSATVSAGTTRVLKLSLSGAAVALLGSHHGRLGAVITVVLRVPGASAHTTSGPVTLRG